MKIEVQVKINEEAYVEGSSTSELASAWVEIEECIKFPVKIRKYMDKKENKEKMFISYPQRKTEQGYSNVVYPSDRAVREEIEARIWESWRHCIVRDFSELPITDARVTLLKGGKQDSKAAARGIATIKLGGITINGIMIKEGRNGLFVQMPQHKSGGEYRDTVYGTSSNMQYRIKTEVLEAYEKEMKRAQGSEEADRKEPEKMTMELFKKKMIEKVINAYEKDSAWMLYILGASPLEMEPAELTEDQILIKTQRATMRHGEDSVIARFVNSFEPSKAGEGAVTEQKIEVTVHKNGERLGTKTVYNLVGTGGEEAAKNYQNMYSRWKVMNEKTEGQKEIERQEEEAARYPEMDPEERQAQEGVKQEQEEDGQIRPEEQQNYGLPPMQPRRYAMDQNGEIRRTWYGKLPEQFNEEDRRNFLAENEARLKQSSAQNPPEEMTPEREKEKSIEKFIEAYDADNIDGMLFLLAAVPLEMNVTEHTEDQSLIRMQYAVMQNDKADIVLARFVNNYEPSKAGKDTITEQKIEVTVHKNGERIGRKTLLRSVGTGETEAAKNYQDMYDKWKLIAGNAKGQKKIERREKKNARHPETPIQAPKL